MYVDYPFCGSDLTNNHIQCIKELREKASHFEKTGLVHTLDSVGNTVVKSDTVVPSQLQNNLRTAFIQQSSDQESDVDWHPRSNEMVQDLVHPSMYPFIYGSLPVTPHF